MPTVYLPEYTLADSQKGLSKVAISSAAEGMLTMACMELAVVSGGKGDPSYHLPPEYIAGFPWQTVESCNKMARQAIEMFAIKDYNDFDNNRELLAQLYGNVTAYQRQGTECVPMKNRWYVREWKKTKIKMPKNEFGVLLYLDSPNGDSGLALAVDGKEFKALTHGVTLTRNSFREGKLRNPAIRTASQNGDWMRLMKERSLLNLFQVRERSRVVNMVAVEAVQCAQNLMYMTPPNYERLQYDDRRGVSQLVATIELIAFQTRNSEADQRISIERTSVAHLKSQCTGPYPDQDLAALLTTHHYPQAVKPKPKKKTVKSK